MKWGFKGKVNLRKVLEVCSEQTDGQEELLILSKDHKYENLNRVSTVNAQI